jgi:hypothetical protein
MVGLATASIIITLVPIPMSIACEKYIVKPIEEYGLVVSGVKAKGNNSQKKE